MEISDQEWRTNLVPGDKVVVYYPQSYRTDKYEIDTVERATSASVFLKKTNARYHRQTGWLVGGGRSSQIIRLTNEVQKRIDRGKRMQSCEHFAFRMHELFVRHARSIDDDQLEELHNALFAARTIVEAIWERKEIEAKL